MPEAYRITIEDPLQIPATVYEAQERGRTQEVHILLDHQEDENVVRGYAEERDSGTRRPDGGLSWYHNETGCYMKAFPTERFRQIRDVTTDWLDEITAYIDQEGIYSSEKIECSGKDADLYLEDGKQLVGTSTHQTRDTTVVRGCWYEEEPESAAFNALLERDGIDPDSFHEHITSFRLLDGLEERLNAERIDAEEFISDTSRERAASLQERDTGGISGSCVMTAYDDL